MAMVARATRMMSVSIALLRAGSAVIRRTDGHSDPLRKTYVAERLYPALRAAKKMAGSRAEYLLMLQR
jgi:hypothetical protein